MNISHELRDDSVVLLNITLSSEDIKEPVADQLKHLRKTAEMPGFRPGKAPASIIEKKYGQAVRFRVINEMTSEEIRHYLKEQGIHTVGGLIMEQDDNTYTPEQTDYKLQISAGLMPQFPETIDSSVTLPHYTVQANDEEIDQMIQNARENAGERTEVEDVQDKDVLYVSVQELDDKGQHATEGITLEESYIMPLYVTNEEIRTEILKAHKGDTLTIDLHKAYDNNDVEIASFLQIKQEEVHEYKNPFEIKIKRILRNNPSPIDEKLFKLMLGPTTKVTNEEELRAELKRLQGERNDAMASDIFTTVVSKYIVEKIQGLTFPDKHLALLLNEKTEEETQEAYDERINKILPYVRYQAMLASLSKQLDVEVPNELIRKIVREGVMRQIQSAGLGQLLSNDELIESIVNSTIEKNDEQLFSAKEQAKEQALAAKVQELVTLDEQKPITIKELYEVHADLQKEINKILGLSDVEPVAPAEA
ncbi:trigger factor [uncultured Porphyromonas sp.]|uniref:trigger factor n=1 Tax=uncultured Porphyromonas sp. TaxID=159274 RepID=UPI002622E761|nr:trigger factor [uncultured Porphyromonas sp.]